MPSNLPRLLYIAGYSRAGSTLLDMMLGAADGVVSTGELTFLLDDAREGTRRCSCGAPYGDCPTFGPWLASRSGRAALKQRALLRAVERRASLRPLIDGKIPASLTAIYRDTWRAFGRDMAGRLGAQVLLDSSKSAEAAAGRALALHRIAGFELRVLHLTRDPRSVVSSYLQTGSNWVLEGHRQKAPLERYRPVLGWQIANRIALSLRSILGDSAYMHLRFEDLTADPCAALTQIEAFADLDLSGVRDAVTAGAPFTAGHNVGGNRARLSPQILRPTTPPPTRLPFGPELLLRLTAGPLTRSLGYA